VLLPNFLANSSKEAVKFPFRRLSHKKDIKTLLLSLSKLQPSSAMGLLSLGEASIVAV
jgi:hypothetical protein